MQWDGTVSDNQEKRKVSSRQRNIIIHIVDNKNVENKYK